MTIPFDLKKDNQRNKQQNRTLMHPHSKHRDYQRWQRPTEDTALDKVDNEIDSRAPYFGLSQSKFEQLLVDLEMMSHYEGGVERAVEHIVKSGIDIKKLLQSL